MKLCDLFVSILTSTQYNLNSKNLLNLEATQSSSRLVNDPGVIQSIKNRMRPSLGSGAGEDAHMSQKQHEMAKSSTSQPGSSNGPPGTHGNDLPKISLDHVEHKSAGPPVMHAGSREAREAALRQAQTPKHSNKLDPAAGPGREARGSSYHMQQRGYGHGPPSGYANESYGGRPASYHEGPPPQNVQPPAPHYGGGDRYSSPRPDRGPSGPGTERYPSYPGRAPHTSSGRDSRGAYSYSSKAGVPPYNSGPSHPAPSYGGPPMPSASFEHREGNRGPGPVYYPDGPVPRSRQPDDSYARAPQYSSSYGGYEGGNRHSGYENQPPPNRHYGGGPPPAISNNGSWGAPGNDRTHPPERGQPYGFDSRGAPPPSAFDQYGPPKRTYSSENPYSAPPPSGPRSAPPQGNYPIGPSSQVPKSRGGPPSQAPIHPAGPIAAKSENLSRTVSGSFEQKSNASHGSFAKASMVHHADTVQQSPAMHTGNNDRPVKRENDREARGTRTHTRSRLESPGLSLDSGFLRFLDSLCGSSLFFTRAFVASIGSWMLATSLSESKELVFTISRSSWCSWPTSSRSRCPCWYGLLVNVLA